MSDSNDTNSVARNILLQKEHMRSLRAYVAAALKLPITPDDYAKQLSLCNSAARQRLEAEIESSAAVNARIKGHCQEFETGALTEMMTLIKNVLKYARKAQNTYPALYASLREVLRAKKNGDSYKDTQEIVKELVETNREDSQAVLDQAYRVSASLRNFTKTTTEDEGYVDRQMRHLDHQGCYIGQVSGPLTTAVQRLKRLVATAEQVPSTDGGGSKKWVSLVGLVPQRVINSPAGEARFKEISELLKRSGKDNAILLEEISLTCEMMSSNWESIRQLLEPAKHAVQVLQGFFEGLQVHLEVIEHTSSRLEQISSALEVYIKQNNDSWPRLVSHVEAFVQSAYMEFESATV